MLAAILQSAGYKTGLYTSPHLVDFRERIRVNGEMITESYVTSFVQKTKALTESIAPSFFELTVAMAFDYFAAERVDVAVIETGLGGRLDSTNIITPVLSIITNIGYDHMNLLGNTLEEIAGEKAGIIKPGIPVVIGEYTAATKEVFLQKARLTGSPVYFASEMYKANEVQVNAKELQTTIINLEQNLASHFTLDLNGLYQVQNLCTVLCAESILRQQGFTISQADEKKALANVRQLTALHGRWEVIATQPAVVLDVAHNEDGMRQVLHQVAVTAHRYKNLHVVIGMVKDKEVEKVLALLPASARYYFTNAHIPRALPAVELQAKAAAFRLAGNCFDDVNAALRDARENAGTNDLILVCGSVFLVGEVEYR